MVSVPEIALFGNRGSDQVAAVREALLAEGAKPLLFDIQLGGPGKATLTMGNGRIFWEGCDFTHIQAIHIRCTAPNTLPALPPVLNDVSHAEWRLQYLREQHFYSATSSFFAYLLSKGKLVVNSLTQGYIDHDSKAQFYEKLRAHGFPVPQTLTTNDPKQAEQFIQQHPATVAKPAVGVGSTRLVRAEDRLRLQELRAAPVMLQERAVGQTLRVHIVADTVVLALRIIPEEDSIDSRTGNKTFEYVKLPEEAERQIVQANRFLGLHFAAWDIIETTEGDYKYLDCNPGPFLMWIGPKFVQVVLRQLAVYMIGFAQSGCLKEASSRVSPWLPGPHREA